MDLEQQILSSQVWKGIEFQTIYIRAMRSMTKTLQATAYTTLMMICLFLLVPQIAAQEIICRVGITYRYIYQSEVSHNYVVTGVMPYSSASTAGVRIGDVIEAIDGIATAQLSIDQMRQLLQDRQRQCLLDLRRGAMYFKLAITPECKIDGEVTERELAWLFSGYSPEDVRDGRLCYLYTGIIYHRSNLSSIRDIEPNSPAHVSGLLPGDVIKKINGIEIEQRALEKLLASYDYFMDQMQVYRLESVSETNQSFAPWSVDAYRHVANQMQRDKNDAIMSYLFAFRPYIRSEPNDILVFEIERSKMTYLVEIRARLREEETTQAGKN